MSRAIFLEAIGEGAAAAVAALTAAGSSERSVDLHRGCLVEQARRAAEGEQPGTRIARVRPHPVRVALDGVDIRAPSVTAARASRLRKKIAANSGGSPACSEWRRRRASRPRAPRAGERDGIARRLVQLGERSDRRALVVAPLRPVDRPVERDVVPVEALRGEQAAVEPGEHPLRPDEIRSPAGRRYSLNRTSAAFAVATVLRSRLPLPSSRTRRRRRDAPGSRPRRVRRPRTRRRRGLGARPAAERAPVEHASAIHSLSSKYTSPPGQAA